MLWFEDNSHLFHLMSWYSTTLDNITDHRHDSKRHQRNALFGFSDQLAINHHKLLGGGFYSCWWVPSSFHVMFVRQTGVWKHHMCGGCEEKVFVGENDIWGTGNYASRRQEAWRAEQWGRQHGGADRRSLSFRQSATSPTFAPKIDLNTEVDKRWPLQHSFDHAAKRLWSKTSDCFKTAAKGIIKTALDFKKKERKKTVKLTF